MKRGTECDRMHRSEEGAEKSTDCRRGDACRHRGAIACRRTAGRRAACHAKARRVRPARLCTDEPRLVLAERPRTRGRDKSRTRRHAVVCPCGLRRLLLRMDRVRQDERNGIQRIRSGPCGTVETLSDHCRLQPHLLRFHRAERIRRAHVPQTRRRLERPPADSQSHGACDRRREFLCDRGPVRHTRRIWH